MSTTQTSILVGNCSCLVALIAPRKRFVIYIWPCLSVFLSCVRGMIDVNPGLDDENHKSTWVMLLLFRSK